MFYVTHTDPGKKSSILLLAGNLRGLYLLLPLSCFVIQAERRISCRLFRLLVSAG
jgi:hypothetical protein